MKEKTTTLNDLIEKIKKGIKDGLTDSILVTFGTKSGRRSTKATIPMHNFLFSIQEYIQEHIEIQTDQNKKNVKIDTCYGKSQSYTPDIALIDKATGKKLIIIEMDAPMRSISKNTHSRNAKSKERGVRVFSHKKNRDSQIYFYNVSSTPLFSPIFKNNAIIKFEEPYIGKETDNENFVNIYDYDEHFKKHYKDIHIVYKINTSIFSNEKIANGEVKNEKDLYKMLTKIDKEDIIEFIDIKELYPLIEHIYNIVNERTTELNAA